MAARAGDGAVEILSARGSLLIAPDGKQQRTLASTRSTRSWSRTSTCPRWCASVSMPHAGDLVLFSSKNRGRVVNFQVEMGSHGGLHLDEQSAFVLTPPNVGFDFAQVRSIRDLYPLFAAYHDGEDQVEFQEAAS